LRIPRDLNRWHEIRGSTALGLPRIAADLPPDLGRWLGSFWWDLVVRSLATWTGWILQLALRSWWDL